MKRAFPDDDFDDETENPQPALKSALPVAEVPVGDPQLPPVSGEEYLRRVRLERSTLPVLVYTHSETDMDDDDEVEEDSLQPALPPPLHNANAPELSQAWAERTLARFAQLHRHLVQLRAPPPARMGPAGIPYTAPPRPPPRQEIQSVLAAMPAAPHPSAPWYDFLYGAPRACAALWRPAVLAALPQPTLVALVEHHAAWLYRASPAAVTSERCKTLYCVLAALDPVLTADDLWHVRCAGKKCAETWLAVRSPPADDAAGAAHDRAAAAHGAALAVVLAIVSLHFEQRDLCRLV